MSRGSHCHIQDNYPLPNCSPLYLHDRLLSFTSFSITTPLFHIEQLSLNKVKTDIELITYSSRNIVDYMPLSYLQAVVDHPLFLTPYFYPKLVNSPKLNFNAIIPLGCLAVGTFLAPK